MEYPTINMAFQLKERNILTLAQYDTLSQLQSECHKAVLLFHITLNDRTPKDKYLEMRQFFDSDRKLWKLSIAMSESEYNKNAIITSLN